MAGQDWFEKDFYAVLGVPSDATQDAIKKAYRKLARQHHPDANAGNAAAERRFKEIGEAYGVLSDTEQRQQYDAVRAMSRGGARFTAGGPGAAGGTAGFEDLLSNLFGATGAGAPGGAGARQNVRFGPGGMSGGTMPGGGMPGGAGAPIFEDLMSMFPGAGTQTAPGHRGGRAPRRGADVTAETTITFRQAVEGAMLTLRVEDSRTGPRTVRARVPAGVREGQKVKLRGKGPPGDLPGEEGDLVVTVHVEKHPLFTLDGADLRITVPVTFAEAVFGAQIDVPTLEGTTVRMKIPAGTPSGRVLRARGHGVKTGRRSAGDLLVTVQVAVPQKLDDRAREALEAFASATKDDGLRGDLAGTARAWAREHGGAGDGKA
jgi:molecular chaperone DnaJ